MTSHIEPDGRQSWVITMTAEIAAVAGVAEGSHVVFYFEQGSVVAEILPPASDDLREEVRQTVEELGEALAEMRRRGD